MPATWSSRVLTRLVQAEVCERDPHICDDLRIARMTVHYAASCEATICGPHVLASYMVLGLHPEKVWPAIEARRKALWGSGEVSVAATVPKKPPQSVKLWAEKTNAARATNSRGAMLVDSQRLTISVPMAAPSINAGYRKPAQPTSGKIPLESPHELVPLVAGSSLHPRHRIVLLSMLECNAFAVVESRNYLYPATLTVAVRLGLPYITVRRAIDRMQKDGVLELAFGANHIFENGDLRRPCTYQVNPDKLCRRMTLAEHRRMRFGRRSRRKEEKTSTVVPISEAEQQSSQAAPQQAPENKTAVTHEPEHRSIRRVTRDERLALFNTYIALKKTGMTHEKAVAEVNRQFKDRFSPADIEYAVKIVGHKRYGDDITEPWSTDNGGHSQPKCLTCEDAGEIWNKGPGPRKIPCPNCQPTVAPEDGA